MSSSATPRSALQSDHDILVQLNTDYINSVQRSDVKRFDEILAPEFYCSSPDGTLVDRAAFLKQTAKPVTIVNLKAEDVMIRIFSSAHDLSKNRFPLLEIMRRATSPSFMHARPTPNRTAARAAGATPTCGPSKTAVGAPSRRM